MYMCVKLPLEYLNPDPCPLHPTSTYINGVIITPTLHSGLIALYY